MKTPVSLMLSPNFAKNYGAYHPLTSSFMTKLEFQHAYPLRKSLCSENVRPLKQIQSNGPISSVKLKHWLFQWCHHLFWYLFRYAIWSQLDIKLRQRMWPSKGIFLFFVVFFKWDSLLASLNRNYKVWNQKKKKSKKMKSI